MSIRVLVVDDQAIVRDGLVTVLSLLPDIEVVGEAADGVEGVRLAEELCPDVVLMDLRMPVADGTWATEQLQRKQPSVAVLVLTTFADDASISGALRVGARGYLTKDASRGEVAAAIRAVASGQTTFAPEIGARLISSFTKSDSRELTAQAGTADASAAASSTADPGAGDADPNPTTFADPTGPASPTASILRRFVGLTQREADVLALIAVGLNNTEIASQLFVSVATVKTHINAIFAKLPVRDRAQAIALVNSVHGLATGESVKRQ